MMDGFSVDLGGTKTAAARIVAGRIEERFQTPTVGNASFASQLDAMGELLLQLGFEEGARLGVAVAGRVDGDGRWQAVNADILPGIAGEPLLHSIRARFGPNTIVRNDAAAAALAEASLGAGIGSEHFAYLTVSTGIGGGVVLNGNLLSSRNGLAGHVGFVSSQLGEARCGSGRYGTVEAVASGRAIAAMAGTRDAKEAFEARTPKSENAIDRSAAAVARLCGDLNSIFGLDRVAIGGSVGLAKGYLPRVEKHLEKEPPLFRVPLTSATLGQDSALLGALLAEG